MPKYPYVTVHHKPNSATYSPVLVAWHPNGYAQVTDRRPDEPDHLSAKRAAVSWAASLSIEFIPHIP